MWIVERRTQVKRRLSRVFSRAESRQLPKKKMGVQNVPFDQYLHNKNKYQRFEM